MPKVSVITLPEEVVQAPTARALAESVPKVKRSFPWQEFFSWIKAVGKALLHQQNLPLNMLALLLGRVSLMGEVAPFGLALFAAIAGLARERAGAVGVWALAGVLSMGFYQKAIIYLISMLLYWRLSDKLSRYEKKVQAVPLFMFGCVFFSGMALLPWQESALYAMMVVFFEATLCMVLAFIFQYGAPLFVNQTKRQEAGSEGLICGIIILTTAIAGLGSLTIYDYSVRNMAGALIIMLLAFSGGSGLGATVGIVTGLVVGLSDGNAASSIAMCALAGMVGGLFRAMGKAAVLLGFMLGSAIAVLYMGRPGELLLVLVEASVAGVAFMLVPAAKLSQWRECCIDEPDSSEATQQTVNAAVDKLNQIAAIFKDLSGAFASGIAKESSIYNEKIKEAQLAQTLSVVGERVCGPCARRNECWEQEFYQTYQAMLDMLALAEAGGIQAGFLPDCIKTTCINRQTLIDQIEQVAEKNRAHWYWHKKLTDCRQVAVEQMKATGMIIGNLAQELTKGPQNDTEVAEMLSERAAVLGCPLTSLQVTSERGKVRVEAQKAVCQGTRECVNTILPTTANLLQEKMILHAECGSKIRHKDCKLVMELAERYHVETGMATMAKGGGEISGDTCVAASVSRGRIALILSDGMGSGEAAANGSGHAVKFLQQLLTAGFDIDTAVKTVNSMLLIKMPGDTFATVDMAVVDTFTGEAEFLKVGSAPSYIKRVREVVTINPAAPPIGILDTIEIEPVRRRLVPGDIVVMVSDGIIDAARGAAKDNWIANFLRRTSSERPQDIADKILYQALEYSGGVAGDDMAVLVARVSEPAGIVQ